MQPASRLARGRDGLCRASQSRSRRSTSGSGAVAAASTAPPERPEAHMFRLWRVAQHLRPRRDVVLCCCGATSAARIRAWSEGQTAGPACRAEWSLQSHCATYCGVRERASGTRASLGRANRTSPAGAPTRIALNCNPIRAAMGYVISAETRRTQLAGLLTRWTRVTIPTPPAPTPSGSPYVPCRASPRPNRRPPLTLKAPR